MFWTLTDNMYPYKGAKHHLLFIHKKHITRIDEIGKDAWLEFHSLLAYIVKERSIPGGTFFMRFGDTRYTGASVAHLHAQLVSSNPDDEAYGPLLARVG